MTDLRADNQLAAIGIDNGLRIIRLAVFGALGFTHNGAVGVGETDLLIRLRFAETLLFFGVFRRWTFG